MTNEIINYMEYILSKHEISLVGNCCYYYKTKSHITTYNSACVWCLIYGTHVDWEFISSSVSQGWQCSRTMICIFFLNCTKRDKWVKCVNKQEEHQCVGIKGK